MKKILFGAAALAIVSTTPALAGDYASIAAGNRALAWTPGGASTMEEARTIAKNLCWKEGFGSCDTAIAESSSWFFSGGYCNGKAYIGASKHGYWKSDQIVRNKASWDNNYDCKITVRFDHGRTTYDSD